MVKRLGVAVVLLLAARLWSFESAQVLFYAPFDGDLKAAIARGAAEPLAGIRPVFEDGARGKAVRVGTSTWNGAAEYPVTKMPVDIGLWHDYGARDTVGPLQYPAAGNINDREGTLSLWYKPLGWAMNNSRDHFIANLGMRDSLAILYSTYFYLVSFQNSVGPDRYQRCVGGWPTEYAERAATKDRWMNLTVAWRDDLMRLWLDGKPLGQQRNDIVPLRNATASLVLGSGDYQEAAFDDVIVLAQAVGDAEAKALYNRNAAADRRGTLAIPPIPAPVLDGKASSPGEWQDAAALTGWADRLLGVADQDQTAVSVGHDAQTLYVRFVYPLPEKFRAERVKYAGVPLKSEAAKQDGDIYRDDYVGVYLSAPGGADVFFFGANAGGARRDEKNGDAAWNGDWQVSQAWNDTAWTVEFAIPLAVLGGVADGRVDINFAHGAQQLDNYQSVWLYRPAVAQPMCAGRLEQRKLAVRVGGIGDLSGGSCSFRAEVAAGGAESFDGTWQVLIKEDGKVLFDSGRKNLHASAGKPGLLAADYAAAQAVCGDLEVNVSDAQGTPLLAYVLPFVFSREIQMETRFIPTPAVLEMMVDLGSTATWEKTAGAKLAVVSSDGKTMLSRPVERFDAIRQQFSLDCAPLPVGTYEARCEVNAGGPPVVLRGSFAKEASPEWLDSNAGVSDRVLPPWTPLRLSGRTVSCWGRDYTFGAAVLPAQIRVNGKDILAGPFRVVVRIGGQTRVLPAGGFRVSQKKDSRVTLRAGAKLGNLEIAGSTWMEFDGFAWSTLRLTPDQAVTIDGLAIEVPLKKEFATLWWPVEYVPSGPGGEAPRQRHASEPMSGLRIGDEEHGMQFFFENFRNWKYAPGKGQELIPGDTEYVVRYNLIDQPTKLDAPQEIQFGYMALPGRPRSPYFRVVNVDAMWTGMARWGGPAETEPRKVTVKPLFSVSPLFTAGWSRHWNYLNFWNREVFEPEFIVNTRKAWGDLWAKSQNTLAMYINTVYSDANTPEYRKYRFEWLPLPGEAPYVPADPKTRDKSDVMGPVCINSRSYVNFYLWSLDKTVRFLSDNGKIPVHMYLDCSNPAECRNVLHGCPADGHVPLLAHRDFMKRMYTVYKSINPANQVYVHCSGWDLMSGWSFSDVMIEGEQMSAYYMAQIANNPKLPKNYTRLITLAKVRSQFQTYAFGPERFYLYQFWGWDTSEPDRAEPARAHLWGLMLSHDSSCWGAGTPRNITRAIAELGWDAQTEFVPYWRKDAGLAVTSPVQPVIASAWRHGDGNLLVLIFNDGDSRGACGLNVDFARYGFKPGAVRCRDYGHGGLPYPDSFQEQEVKDATVEFGKPVPVEIAERSYRLLRFFQP